MSYEQMVRDAAIRQGINPDLAVAVARTESGLNPKAVSPAGAQGIMQLMPGTARELGVSNPFDASSNINGGVRYLGRMLKQFGGDQSKALAAYNTGPGTVQRRGITGAGQEYIRLVNRYMPSRGAARPVQPAEEVKTTMINPLYNQFPDIFSGAKAAFGMPDEEQRKKAVDGLISMAAQRNMPGNLQQQLFGNAYTQPSVPVNANPTIPSAPAQPSFTRPDERRSFDFGISKAYPNANIPENFDWSFGAQQAPASTAPVTLPAQPDLATQLRERVALFRELGLLPTRAELPAYPDAKKAESEAKRQSKIGSWLIPLAGLAYALSGRNTRGYRDNRLALGVLKASNNLFGSSQNILDKQQAEQKAYGEQQRQAYDTYNDKTRSALMGILGDITKDNKTSAIEVRNALQALGYVDINGQIRPTLDNLQLKGTLADKAAGREIELQKENRLSEQAVNLNNYRNNRNEIDMKRLDADIQYKGDRLGLTQQQIDFNKWKAKEQIRQSGERINETERHNRTSEGTARINAAANVTRANKGPAGGKQTEGDKNKALRGKYINEWDRLQQQRRAYHGDPATISEIQRKEDRLRRAWRTDFGSSNFDVIVTGKKPDDFLSLLGQK